MSGAIAETPEDSPLVIGPLELRLTDRDALVDGRRLGLTMREFEVLAALAEKADRVVSREAVYDRVWGGRMPHRDRAVDVHVKRLRTKMAATAPEWTFIHTHFGSGYRLNPEPSE
jgi:two-component system OmpR family response regulator